MKVNLYLITNAKTDFDLYFTRLAPGKGDKNYIIPAETLNDIRTLKICCYCTFGFII